HKTAESSTKCGSDMKFYPGIILCAYDHRLIPGPLEPSFHCGRLIQCRISSHGDPVDPVVLADDSGEVLLQELLLQTVCIGAVPECAGLHRVGAGGEAVVRKVSVPLERIQDSVCDGCGDIIEIIVKEQVVGIGVDESDLHQY